MSFDSDFNRMRRNHDRMQKFVLTFIGIIFALIICWFIFIGVMLVKASGTIEKVGLSGAIEQVWCGERKDCKLPEILK
jgi:cell division septal protein FtsQ